MSPLGRRDSDPPDYETTVGGVNPPQVSPPLPGLVTEPSALGPQRGPSPPTGVVGLAWDGWVEPEPEAHLPGMPSDSTMYTFSQVSPTAMILLPPASLLGSLGSLYHITVAPSLFTGSATVTSIREGGSERGVFVADFQTVVTGFKVTKQPGTVCIRGNELDITQVLSGVPESVDRLAKKGPLELGRWKFADTELVWEYSNDTQSTARTNSCYLVIDNQRTLCAKFKPPHGAARHGRKGTAILDVTRQGHRILEQILVSALMIERIVTTPVIPDARKRKSSFF
ncbi:para-aminobenzoate synthase, (PABA) [Marasmius sp. AFHP31]|nr:para-aminobenzoate synthase, (PABA) [Marasmius sp. AFHP31]